MARDTKLDGDMTETLLEFRIVSPVPAESAGAEESAPAVVYRKPWDSPRRLTPQSGTVPDFLLLLHHQLLRLREAVRVEPDKIHAGAQAAQVKRK